MRMIQLSAPNRSRTVPLPETGIFDNNGHLFHHAVACPLISVHKQRLEEHGIFIKKRNLTEDDNKKLLSNWRKFEEEHNLEMKDLLSLINFRVDKSEVQKRTPEMMQKKEFINKSFFWPRMCDGFPHSTAEAIKARLLVLFDPAKEIEGALDPLTEEEEHVAIKMYRKGTKFQEIADHFKKTYRLIKQRIIFLTTYKMDFSRSERRRLWNIICESLEETPNDLASLSLLKIDWTKIGRILFRDQKILRIEWNLIVAELSAFCSNGMAWDEAFERVVPECENIFPSEFADFVDMFIEEKENADTLHCTSHEKLHFKSEMRKRGITGFKTGRLSEYKFCRYKMGRVFFAIRRNLLEPTHLCLSLSSHLKLISRCFRAFANSTCKVSRVQLRRHLVVNELIRQLSKDDPNWKPSRKLRKYIEENI